MGVVWEFWRAEKTLGPCLRRGDGGKNEFTLSIEFTCKLDFWQSSLDESEQESVSASVGLLEVLGPNLGFPHSSGINGSRHEPMRELRVQHRGRPYRVLHAFDPRRSLNLLLGGDKTGDDRWYVVNIPVADRRYAEPLALG